MSFLIGVHYAPFAVAYTLGRQANGDQNKGKAIWALNVVFFSQMLLFIGVYNILIRALNPVGRLSIPVILYGLAFIYIFDSLTYLRNNKGLEFIRKIDAMPVVAKKRFYAIGRLYLLISIIIAFIFINIDNH
jgi:hypothetical protein